jgi:uncharacterized membrane protein required for colicin V production
MMSIVYLFWMYVALFAFIGWMRGWAKELLVSFSVILSLALNYIIRRYIPLARSLEEADPSLFWMRVSILVMLVYFGYQTVISIPHLVSRSGVVRERLQDTLFGAFLGALNGYFIAGSILYYIHVTNYTVMQNIITKPTEPNLVQAVNEMMAYMPPQLLGEPGIYFAIILAFVFVLVVYI